MIDFRRHIRPFFLTPDGQRPTPYKVYYNILSYFTTQLAFCFTTAPFVLLSLPSSLLVWSRVYFYAVLGTAASMALFASPAKPYLIRKLHARNRSAVPQPRRASAGTDDDKERDGHVSDHPLMGLPSDPAQDVEEVIQEIREEVEARRRKGAAVKMPTGLEMKAAVKDKLARDA